VLLASLALSSEGGLDVVGKRFLHGAERGLFQPGVSAPHLWIDAWQVALAVCCDAAIPGHTQEAAERGAVGEARIYECHRQRLVTE
jgi:hypothetical protein